MMIAQVVPIKVQNFAHGKVFNFLGNDKDRQIWGGNPTGLIQLNDIKYGWAMNIYNAMRENFWIPQRMDITPDVIDYQHLTGAEKKAFKGILAYLTFLDSVQTFNLPYLKVAITAPEIAICLNEQASQEAMHNQSYQCIIETIIPKDERSAVYEFWRENKFLASRCSIIANLYQYYVDEPTAENYFISLFADFLLEGLYFYNGFIFFYVLASRRLMSGCADILRLINRDELSHVKLHQKLVEEAMKVLPWSKDFVYELTNAAVEQECAWTNHIIGNDVLGITEISTEQYTKYLANIRLQAIGLKPLYEDFKKSPYQHLERFADTKAEGHTKGNFFESGITGYNQSSAIGGWDF